MLNTELTENTEGTAWKNNEKLLKLFAGGEASGLVRG